MQKMKLDCLLTPHTRMNSKWIKDLNVICKTIKILEKNISRQMSKVSGNNIFYDTSPWPRETKAKINKGDYIKLKYLHSKGTCQQNEKTTH